MTSWEADVIRLYFGLGEPAHPRNRRAFDLTRERVRQIKEKAIRRLKHTSRSHPEVLLGLIVSDFHNTRRCRAKRAPFQGPFLVDGLWGILWNPQLAWRPAESQVIHRKDIGTLELEHQMHLDCPAYKPLTRSLLDDVSPPTSPRHQMSQ